MNRPTVFAMLGRAGDVINLLPVLKRFRDQTGETPFYLVGREFAGVLDGVSYATPLVWQGPWQDCLGAIKWAQKTLPNPAIVNAAVYGLGYFPITRTASFDREAWDRAGADVPFGRLPLVFDRRDRAREESLASRVLREAGVSAGEPFALAAFSGVSSPFAGAPAVIAALRAAGIRVVDLSDVRAERIYDLLGLYERAAVLVAGDSAPLHLAPAVPSLPVVMLTADQKNRWHRSSWRPQHKARLFYSEATLDPSIVVRAAERALAGARTPRFVRVHAYLGKPSADAERRIAVARESWAEEARWSGRWDDLFFDRLARDSRSIGDPAPCPFSRDLIDLALDCCEHWDDVVVLSNADVGISPGFTGWLVEALIRSGAAFTHRWDRAHPIARPFVSEAETCAGRWYPGSDVWAFTKAWWATWGDRFPDMVIGREAGDMVLRHVIKQGDGVEIPGAVWHERHASFWEQPGNRDGLPSNVHNRLLATAFLRDFGGKWNDGKEVRPGLR